MEDPRGTNRRFTVFVDADAFVALARANDANHRRALHLLSFLTQRLVKFITSNYVFAESVTVISQRVSHQAALSYIKEMQSPEFPMRVHWIDEEIERQAIQVFAKQTSKNVSFVDCTNMAILENESIDHIFSFDEVYRRNGYHLVSELVKQ